MGTSATPAPDRPNSDSDPDQYDIDPRLIAASRIILLVLLALLGLELAL